MATRVVMIDRRRRGRDFHLEVSWKWWGVSEAPPPSAVCSLALAAEARMHAGEPATASGGWRREQYLG